MKLAIYSLIILMMPLAVAAQRYYPTGIQSKELIGLQLGTTSFHGDVEGVRSFELSSPNIGLSYEYRPAARIGLRATALWYKIAASDAESKNAGLRSRNLSFSATNWEGSLMGVVYLQPYRPHDFYNRQKVNAYVQGGVGIAYFNPEADYMGNSWELRNMQTEGVRYSRVALVVPFGGGLLFRLSPKLDLGLDLTYHHTFSDYLDDVSSTYISQDAFSDPVAAALADRRPEINIPNVQAGAVRGNPDANDGYAIISLRTVYYLSRLHFRGEDIKRERQWHSVGEEKEK